MDATLEDTLNRIERLTEGLMEFWKNPVGWAPLNACALLNRSMLEWQTSLAKSLRHWCDSTSDGDLILAWTNLGALVEGQLRLFLSIWYETYRGDVAAIRNRQGEMQDPDSCRLEDLRQFFQRRIWITGRDFNSYVNTVQNRRNAIHAFRQREIGTFDEWKTMLRMHLDFVRDINNRLPYPDREIYAPRG